MGGPRDWATWVVCAGAEEGGWQWQWQWAEGVEDGRDVVGDAEVSRCVGGGGWVVWALYV